MKRKRKQVLYIQLNDWEGPQQKDHVYYKVLRRLLAHDPEFPLPYSCSGYDHALFFFVTCTPEQLEALGWLPLMAESTRNKHFRPFNADGTPSGIWPPPGTPPGYWEDGPSMDSIEFGEWNKNGIFQLCEAEDED